MFPYIHDMRHLTIGPIGIFGSEKWFKAFCSLATTPHIRHITAIGTCALGLMRLLEDGDRSFAMLERISPREIRGVLLIEALQRTPNHSKDERCDRRLVLSVQSGHSLDAESLEVLRKAVGALTVEEDP